MSSSPFACNEASELPCECQYLAGTTEINKNFIFDGHKHSSYIMFGVMGLFFGSVLIYFFRLRKEVSFKARSPKLITLGVILIALDVYGNIMIYSGTSDESHWNRTCNV